MKHGLIALVCFFIIGCAAPIIEESLPVPAKKDMMLIAEDCC